MPTSASLMLLIFSHGEIEWRALETGIKRKVKNKQGKNLIIHRFSMLVLGAIS